MNPRNTSNKNENLATIEFEFKNSFDPDSKESTDPEPKLLNDGKNDPESGPSVVAGTLDDDEDEDEDDDDEDGEDENAFLKESGIIDPLPLDPDPELDPLPNPRNPLLDPLEPLPEPLLEPLNMILNT